MKTARRNAIHFAILGAVLGGILVLGTTGCGTSATAQDTLVVGEVLQALDGIVVLGRDLQSECRIRPAPGGGLALQDPNGVSIINPQAAAQGPGHTLFFGPNDNPMGCRIRGVPGAGLFFEDPNGFIFTRGVQVQGDITADNFIQASSRRLKANIRPIADALERITRLEGVYFDWKPERGGGAAVGFVAEDVAEVLPQAVSRNAATGRVEGVKYANVVAVAVEGIKVQEARLDRLTAENTKLRSKVDAMESRLEQLLARLAQLEAK